MENKQYYIWDDKREYQGIITKSHGYTPNLKYYREVEIPDCPETPDLTPSKPELPDGWYFTYHDGFVNPIIREKRGERTYNLDSTEVLGVHWDTHDVVASLGDVEFTEEGESYLLRPPKKRP